MQELVKLLRRKNKTIGSCESLTAGLFTSLLAEVPGASAVLKGGIVSYQTQIKERVVHVDEKLIRQYGVISAECAAAMAQQARVLLDVDLCVSFTGNAGPSAMEGKPAGCVYCALADERGCTVYAYQFHHASRNTVRQKVVEAMKQNVIEYLKKE